MRPAELRWTRIGFSAAAILTFAAALLAYVRPELRVWGLHHLAFLPWPAAAGLAVGAMALFTPQGGRIWDWLVGQTKGLAGRSAVLWALAAIVVFSSLRISIPLLGDGALWIKELSWIGEFKARGQHVPYKRWQTRKEPLEITLHEAVFRTATHFRPADRWGSSGASVTDALQKREAWFLSAARLTYVSLSILAGALAVHIALRFARRRLPPASRTPFLLTLFGGGGILLFFGYVEHYSLVSVAILLFLFAGLEDCFQPRRFPLRTLLTFLLAVAFHLAAVFLLPAVLWMAVQWFLGKSPPQPPSSSPVNGGMSDPLSPRERGGEINARRSALIVLSALAVVGLAGYVWVEGWKGWVSILPLVPAFSQDGYAFFSVTHWLDVLNLLALAAAAAVVLLLTIPRQRDASDTEQRQNIFLMLAVCGGVAFTVSFNPNLGMARDWDLLAAALWPLCLWGAWKFARIDLGAARSATLATLTGVILLTTVPFVLVQARASWSVRHFEALLRMDSSRSAYGWENLAVHYETHGDLEGRIRAWRAAMSGSANPRYKINLSVALRLNGQLEEAETLCIPAVREKPDYSYQLTYLAAAYRERGNAEKTLELLRLACELNPADTTARKLLMHEERKAMSDE